MLQIIELRHLRSIEYWQAVAAAIGYASSTHLDDVLLKLDTLLKVESKKSSGLFGFMKVSFRFWFDR